MGKENIISKGLYTGVQHPELASVKQFIIIKDNGEKYLLLRMKNDRKEMLNTLSFVLKQYDVKGNVIETRQIIQEGLSVKAGAVFTLENKIKISDACIDFSVEVTSVACGCFTYQSRKGDLIASYGKGNGVAPVDRVSIYRQMGNKTRRMSIRTLKAPGALFISMAVVLLIVAAFSFFQIWRFTQTEEFFTLDSVEYTFETDDRDGPICIIGYKGSAGNIIVPEEIEGHKVARISKEAFKDAGLFTVVVEGNTVIEEGAFANNGMLYEVSLKKATVIEKKAFANCSSLKSVALGKGIKKISQSTFEGCKSLKSITIPDTVVQIEDRAFYGCSSLESIVIPKGVTNIGNACFYNCTSVKKLEAPFIGNNIQDKKTISFFFENGSVASSYSSIEEIKLTNAAYISNGAFKGCGNLESVSISGSVTAIGNEAFAECRRLSKVDIPDTVVSIGSSAFLNCGVLTDFTLPTSLKTIGNSALYGCRSIKSVTVPVGVASIPDSTFYDCISLSTVKLPDGLKRIEKNAFRNCRSVKELTIPDSIEYISASALHGCSGITTLSLPYIGEDKDNAYTLSELFGGATESLKKITVSSQNGDILPYTFSDFTGLTDISVSGNATAIGAYAFKNCASLVSINLPSTIEGVGDGVFYGCSSLVSVTLPDTVTDINPYLFYGCEKLENINLSDGITTVGDYAFSGCASITSVEWLAMCSSVGEYAFENCISLDSAALPISIEAVPTGVFSGCSGLKSVTVPGTVKIIKKDAFKGCAELLEINIPIVVEEIEDDAFNGCASITAISIPSATVKLGDGAFANCTGVTSLVIPDTVQRMGAGLLSGCTSLTDLTLPYMGGAVDNHTNAEHLFGVGGAHALKNITLTSTVALRDGAFAGCSSVTNIVLNDGVEVIGENAFSDCVSLTNVNIPSSVVEIRAKAFSNCSSLDSFTIPNTVLRIGDGIFDQCYSLDEITVPFIGADINTDSTVSNMFNGVIPVSLKKITVTDATSIGDSAFASCTKVTEITINSGVENIGSSAFLDCYSLAEIEIPDSVTSIGQEAFKNCTSLTSVTIPNSVQTFGNNSLMGCTSLTEISLPFIGETRSTESTLINAQFNGSVIGVPDGLVKITVTDSTTIPDRAFARLGKVTELNFSCDVTSIGQSAFSNCSSITYLEIPKTVTYIGQNAFTGCTALEELSVPFAGCHASDSTIFLTMFENGNIPTSLKKVTVTNSEYIKSSAFEGCNGIEEIIIDCNITYIGNNAFNDCISLRSVNIPDGTERIASCAFSNCYSMEEITIPASVTTIEWQAFRWCYRLYEIYNYSSVNLSSIYDNTYASYYALAFYGVGEEPVKIDIDGYSFLLGDNGEWYLIDYTGENTKLVFPSSFEYGVGGASDTVESYNIAPYAFFLRSELERVTLPSSIQNIGSSAFNGCNILREVYNLTSLDIQIESFDHGMVAYSAYIVHTSLDAEPLTKVTIDSFEFLKSDDHWFIIGYTGNSATVNLGSFTYGDDTVDEYVIVDEAFNGNSFIKELTIGNEVKKIGSFAFNGCGSLEKLSFENNTSITEIRDFCFASCNNLKQVILPSSLTFIGNNSFSDCGSLIEVYNLSEIDIRVGSTGNGYVAYNALIVHDSMDDEALNEVEIEDCTYLKSDSVWFLTKYDGSDEIITLGNIEYDGSIYTSYTILPGAFNNNESIKEVIITDAVKSIGNSAFANCTNLRKVSFRDNTSITTIEAEMFAYCSNLESVVLPSTLTNIKTRAFYRCYSLVEIYNPSVMELNIGTSYNGYVAYYADVIRTSLSEQGYEFETVQSDGATFKFYKDNGTWYLYTVYNGPSNMRKLPKLTVSSEEQSYKVKGRVLSSSSVLVPSFVTEILEFNRVSAGRIYYEGTEEQWLTVVNGANYSDKAMLYYVECVHSYTGEWNYKDNEINVTPEFSTAVIRDASCVEEGELEISCKNCDYKYTETIAITTHSFGADNKCTVCEMQFSLTDLNNDWTVTNNSSRPFAIDSVTGAISSTNKTDNSTSRFTMEAKNDMTVYIVYSTSTESGWDKLRIYLNGSLLVEESGELRDMYIQLDISAGDILVFEYAKDNSSSHGTDTVTINKILVSTTGSGE
ncbi:MAG: leucine-rich repeat domain-containing protein [Clostridia bacterium]|nr:leucine-rich repeat domain-containing protein [Clostridia bacterium]